MQGQVKKIVSEKKYGFITTAQMDYFFHKDDFDGHWNDLDKDFSRGKVIEVEFEPVRSEKGLRASEVRRLDGGRA